MDQNWKHFYAREILDSRGNPTVEVEAYLEGGVIEELLFHQEHQLEYTKQLTKRWRYKSRYLEKVVLKAVSM